MLQFSTVLALATPAAPQQRGQGGGMGLMLGMMIFIGVFFFMITRSQKRAKTRKKDMLDGKLNATVAAWYLATFVLPDLPVDWSSPREIALLTQAWNSGPGATKRVLASLPMERPTVDDVRKAAQRIRQLGVDFRGLSAEKYKWLAIRKTKWAKGVARATLDAMANANFTKPSGPQWTPAALFSWLWERLRCR